ncbi:hypothetical protein IID04_07090 [PVC group bacterium]|nr:hypothetical protein [PVC group bacterium]
MAKTIQAIGLGAISIGFLLKFPHLMDPKLFMSGIAVFIIGWLMERMKR